jgi:hypothetical protein
LFLSALSSSLFLFSQASIPASPSGSSEAVSVPDSLGSLPPFDVSRDYKVPGATLEKLRLDWIALEKKLALSQTESQSAKDTLTGLREPLAMLNQSLKTSADSFAAFRTQTSLELWAWRAAAAIALGFGIYESVK